MTSSPTFYLHKNNTAYVGEASPNTKCDRFLLGEIFG